MENLDFKKMREIIINKRFEIIIIMLTSLFIGLIFTFFVNKPKYKSYTTLILGKVDNVVKIDFDKKEIVQSEILITSNLVDTYEQVIKSRSFSQAVINKLGSKISQEDFVKAVNIRNIFNTEVLEISAENENPDLACSIANATAQIFGEKVQDIHGVDKISVLDFAIPSDTPYNVHHIQDVAIALFIGLVTSIGFVYLYYLIYEKPFIENEKRVKEINKKEIKENGSINNNIVVKKVIEKESNEESFVKPRSQILDVVESKNVYGEQEMPRNTVNVIEEKYVLEKGEVYDAEVNEKGIIVYPGKAIKRMFKLIKDMIVSTYRGLKILWKRVKIITLKLVKIIKHNYKVFKEKNEVKKAEKEKVLEQKRIEKEKELEQKRIEKEKILEEK